jgi:putative ribosome biogenesis GTPase RsgA
LNKSDLPDWEVDEKQIQKAQEMGIKMLYTSAKMGTAVREAFETLAREVLGES